MFIGLKNSFIKTSHNLPLSEPYAEESEKLDGIHNFHIFFFSQINHMQQIMLVYVLIILVLKKF